MLFGLNKLKQALRLQLAHGQGYLQMPNCVLLKECGDFTSIGHENLHVWLVWPHQSKQDLPLQLVHGSAANIAYSVDNSSKS